MSILITGMEMPLYCDTDCPGIKFRVCPIKELGEALMYRYEEIRHPDCPIVEVPPHGRLIDEKDAIKSTWMVLKGLGYYGLGNKGLTETVKAVFKTAPAIIEAEPPREET